MNILHTMIKYINYPTVFIIFIIPFLFFHFHHYDQKCKHMSVQCLISENIKL
ncbi:uncharacterized protein Smp_204270 [Schistosoma mansoni]|uniref:uncharacterized protein n=1 Tax=Schistosoma mansoni TaxID=6183 RepID=UPI00022DCB4B|nr:uncharacterized protein Smp_204270 [Schistosoma mansoni]|eukprot:XP_018655439.1 uncharacterized protein Smp_204270 [Schistosoma mansoni]